ncbi:Hsp20/alpha crystallin family protein [Deinococcus peraridilitoris]|uniref:Molecular chaperone (Small heat shock protein) n=1 Tax=Deinococcus peraridilitoris (strain DSM 19664 / LMG 22246 / CIP 109416 / KR-200) TaxID=937777 RepID=L0A4T3_DEIPD|nr:Hsp20/alpha crystallin family protein [Deinococcus peraridilitoris]AFZ68893.1 molecular chaperone (small heat shock protein) [Deinococcus peraridilitoris DSM 19664]
MMRFDPFRDIEELQQRVDRMFGSGTSNHTSQRFSPTVDIHEDDGGLDISLDLPGIDPGNIKLEAENNTVTVQAERKYDQGGRTAHRVERAYGTFVRTFNVPPRYDLGKIEALYAHGTLSLRVPRAEAAQRRSIPIKGMSNDAVQTLEAGAAQRPQAMQESQSEASLSS